MRDCIVIHKLLKLKNIYYSELNAWNNSFPKIINPPENHIEVMEMRFCGNNLNMYALKELFAFAIL